MTAAGFVLTDEPGIWDARSSRPASTTMSSFPSTSSFRWRSPQAPVDGRLASPVSTASTAPGRAKASERALVDHGPVEITAIDPADENPS